MPRRLGQLVGDLGLGLVECQVEQLEAAEQVTVHAVALQHPADGLLGRVERLDADAAGTSVASRGSITVAAIPTL